MAGFDSLDGIRDDPDSARRRCEALRAALAQYTAQQGQVICGSVGARFKLISLTLALVFSVCNGIFVVLEIAFRGHIPVLLIFVHVTVCAVVFFLNSADSFRSRVFAFLLLLCGAILSCVLVLLRWQEFSTRAELLLLVAESIFGLVFAYCLYNYLLEEYELKRLHRELQQFEQLLSDERVGDNEDACEARP